MKRVSSPQPAIEIHVERGQQACLWYPRELWVQNQLTKVRRKVKYEAKNRLLEAEYDSSSQSVSLHQHVHEAQTERQHFVPGETSEKLFLKKPNKSRKVKLLKGT